MTQAIAKRDQVRSLQEYLEKAQGTFAQVLPKHITPQRMVKVALTAALKTPLLLACTKESLFQALITASELGLEPGGALGHGYLVPYKNKKGQYLAQFIPGYRGFIDLARRTGQVASLQAHVVRTGDIFIYELGLEPKLVHRPNLLEQQGELRHVYAVARFTDAGAEPQVEVMSKTQIDAIRKRSKARDDGPWVTDYEEMARKTVVRRIAKYLPMSAELQKAIELHDTVEAGDGPADVIDLGAVSVETPNEDAEPALEDANVALAGKLKSAAEKLEAPADDEAEQAEAGIAAEQAAKTEGA